ncbi:hypothetical protein MPTK2_4g08440 [Marchantia polymorpha subsp. ruderalis]
MCQHSLSINYLRHGDHYPGHIKGYDHVISYTLVRVVYNNIGQGLQEKWYAHISLLCTSGIEVAYTYVSKPGHVFNKVKKSLFSYQVIVLIAWWQ